MPTGTERAFDESTIGSLGRHFEPGEVLVVNASRVRPARVVGRKASGGRVELLVLEQPAPRRWRALVGASRSPRPGSEIRLEDDVVVRVSARSEEVFELEEVAGDLARCLDRHGVPPLPPYIRREPRPEDFARYQSTFARADGGRWGSAGSSVAAPTAGLHLTPRLLDALRARGVTIAQVSLGVGLGTFRPIEVDRLADHRMHEEAFEIDQASASAVDAALREGRRVTAVGTTSLRALEAAATPRGRIRALGARTGLFAVPGTRLRTATRLLTNFHRPHSTLLALVAGFAGLDRALAAHREAVARGFRLFSYGDAMLVERA